MRAVFIGGPADGGELTMYEPILERLSFPLTTLEAVELLDPTTRPGHLVPNVPGTYDLDMAGDRPRRDAFGRVRYLYRCKPTPPKETQTDD